MKTVRALSIAACLGTAAGAGIARAEEPYKIGVSAGLTGYAAAVDRAWRDGLEVAADHVNSRGGVMGRKVGDAGSRRGDGKTRRRTNRG